MIRPSASPSDMADEGFSLIEVLVVITIIAVLAAIAIPMFLNQRERGWESQAQSLLRNAAIAMESCGAPGGGVYTDCTTFAALRADGFRPGVFAEGADVTIAVRDSDEGVDDGAYLIEAAHPSGGRTFELDSDIGAVVAQ